MAGQISEGVVGVTGTPGVGKKSVAPVLATLLGFESLSINDAARAHGLITKTRSEWEVDTDKLRARLGGLSGHTVLYGHLLPHVIEARLVSHVLVLRCEPSVLKRRLEARGYPSRKVRDNVESELIGLVSSEAFEAFGEEKTFEIDATSSSPSATARAANEVIAAESGAGSRIDWTIGYDTGAKLRSLLSAGGS